MSNAAATEHGSTPEYLKRYERQQGIQLQSSKILDELENQGIIPVGRRASAAGEAYSITLEDGEAVRRRPPVRLESLKAAKEQRLPSREECEEKMRLVEERRKLKENELKTRLRAKSARVRVPAPGAVSEAGEEAAPGPGAWTDQRVSTDLLGPASLSQVERGEAEGAERERERCHDVRVDGEKEEGDREEEEEEE
ncbi:unnamed protein product [Tetraodon nigroviridis]|nr:unnamed protein product [Tetraodon nigroviridis]